MKRTVASLAVLSLGVASCAQWIPVPTSDLTDRAHYGRSRLTLSDSTVYTLSDVWVLDGVVTGNSGSQLVGIPVESVTRAEAAETSLVAAGYAVVIGTGAAIIAVRVLNQHDPVNGY